MADISPYISIIELAARGEEVRDAIVNSLNGINDSIPGSVEDALEEAKESGEFDGYSPEVTITAITGGTTVNITDADHPSGQDFNVMNGANGTDGVSPEVTITAITGGTEVTITDEDHPGGQSFNVMNGEDSIVEVGTINLTTSWTNAGGDVYTQAVTIPNVTSVSKIDLQPDSTVIAQLVSDVTTAIWAVNNAGVITVYAYGNAPTTALSVQYSRTEVEI